MSYWKAVAIAHDQLINAWAGGWPDETLSSRCWRWHVSGKRHWPRKLVDGIFFWDRDKDTGKRHCELSFESERLRLQAPPECRN